MKKYLFLCSILFSFSFAGDSTLLDKKESIQKTDAKVNPSAETFKPLIEKTGDLKRDFDKIPYNEKELKRLKEMQDKHLKDTEDVKSKTILSNVKTFEEIKLSKLNDLKPYEQVKLCIEKATDSSQISICENTLSAQLFNISMKKSNEIEKNSIVESLKK